MPTYNVALLQMTPCADPEAAIATISYKLVATQAR